MSIPRLAIHRPVTMFMISAVITLLGAIFLKGFKEAIGLAGLLVSVYLLLNLTVLAWSVGYLWQHPALFADWTRAIFEQHGNPMYAIALAALAGRFRQDRHPRRDQAESVESEREKAARDMTREEISRNLGIARQVAAIATAFFLPLSTSGTAIAVSIFAVLVFCWGTPYGLTVESGDAVVYLESARNIASGNGFVFAIPPLPPASVT